MIILRKLSHLIKITILLKIEKLKFIQANSAQNQGLAMAQQKQYASVLRDKHLKYKKLNLLVITDD